MNSAGQLVRWTDTRAIVPSSKTWSCCLSSRDIALEGHEHRTMWHEKKGHTIRRYPKRPDPEDVDESLTLVA